MTSTTISPSIDQGALLQFRNNFFELAQQTDSFLVNSKSVTHLPSNGKTHNMARMGRLELTEVSARNPDKQYSDYSLDNRQFSKRRFTKTVTVDAKFDVNELIADPTSDILRQLLNAKERVVDRVLIAAAVGDVLTGAPDAAPTSTTATADGVLTVDATAGFTYGTVQEITENFINNELPMSLITGSVINISGSENTDLMSEVEFISNDYISGSVVDQGFTSRAGTYMVNLFAGSKTGGITVSNPILPEGATTRQNVVLAPDALSLAMEIGDLSVTPNNSKVNSNDITIDLWINAMRNEGARVQIVNSTI